MSLKDVKAKFDPFKIVPGWTQEMYDDCVYNKDERFVHEVTPELPQCPRCNLYTDDPEHYCGSVALVQSCNGNHPESPRFWRWLLFCKDWGKY